MMLEQPLARAYELTRSIAAAASQDNWLGAAELVEQRSPLLLSLKAEQTEEALAVIREIQMLDDAIMQRATGARETISDKFQEAQRRVAAAGFYQKTGQLR